MNFIVSLSPTEVQWSTNGCVNRDFIMDDRPKVVIFVWMGVQVDTANYD